MSSSHTHYPRTLTDEEIRTTYFIVPPNLMKMFCPPEFVEYVEAEWRIAIENGAALDVIGWGNGMTMLWTRPNPDVPIDTEELFQYVKAHQRANQFLQTHTVHHD